MTEDKFQRKAKELVAQMTLEEKVSQLSYTSPAIDRLDIPAYNWWNECLHGVARAGKATVFPQAIGLGAMFDRNHMSEISVTISDEARAKWNDFQARGKRGIYQGLTFWTPNINIFRDPRWGRGMETYGEDPYLTGELGSRFVEGLQGEDPNYLKLVATAKHFIVHSGPESERHSFDARPSKADFLYTYAPHFEKVVKEAGVYSVMCAYNRFEGEPCCGNPELNTLLRDDWGFSGYVVSDCWAVNDFFEEDAHGVTDSAEKAAAMAIKAGTDLNCGNSYPALVKSVNEGHISEKEIDISLERLLVARMKLGLFELNGDNVYDNIPYSVVESKEHKAISLEAARKSMVLLKNEGDLLPLSKDLKKIAVIGSNADDLEVLLGNYNGFPTTPVTPLNGIRRKLPNAEVTYAVGCSLAEGLPIFEAIPEQVVFTDESLEQHGLRAAYFDNTDLSGEPKHRRIDAKVDFVWGTTPPFEDLSYDSFSVRWEGFIKVPQTGKYPIGGEAFSGMKIYIDDEELITYENEHHPRKEYEFINLDEDKVYELRIEYTQDNSEYAMMRLLWERPRNDLKSQALQAVAESDVAILCMGISPLLEGEEMKVKVDGFSGGDRVHIGLPETQKQLIREIQDLGKPLVLVLFNGSALSINWENEHLPAIVEAWYPGQEGGTALADLLFGDHNPAGRLPVTFYKNVNDLPDFNDYSMQGRTYRYFTDEVLYEFGFGLSYTKFEYSDLILSDQIETGQTTQVKVRVKNTGPRDGEEVVQLYLNRTGEIENSPLRTLAGFERLHLKVGEEKELTFTLTPQELFTVSKENKKVVQTESIRVSVGGFQYSEERENKKEVISGIMKISGADYSL